MDIKFKKKESFVEVISQLKHVGTQMHIFHLQTQSYAEHMALGGFYDGLPGLIDGLVETVQGKEQSLVKGYKAFPFADYTSSAATLQYLQNLLLKIESYRLSLPKSWANIDNQLQVVIDLTESTMYKLKFLK